MAMALISAIHIPVTKSDPSALIKMKPPWAYLHFFGEIRRSILLRSLSLGWSALRIHPLAYVHGFLRRRTKDISTREAKPPLFLLRCLMDFLLYCLYERSSNPASATAVKPWVSTRTGRCSLERNK